MMRFWLSALSWILLVNSRALTSSCGPGKFLPDGFQYGHCLDCKTCQEGTEESSPCTKRSDVECKCLEGFKRQNPIVCICDVGHGIDSTGKKCVECETGFFSDKKDAESKCRKWNDCGHLGVKVQGSSTSNVICNTATSSPNLPMKASTPIAMVLTTAATVVLPQVNSTSIVPSLAFSTKLKATTAPASHYYNGMVGLLITAFILLILCFALIFKLAAGLCLNRLKKPILRAETVCRTPVEESGDKSCSSLVSSTNSSQLIEDV